MKKTHLLRAFLAAAAGTALLAAGPAVKAEAAVPGYLKAATYFSDAWVTNFWNTESDHMEEELAQIAADGFNSIILVIPWREFQPTMMPVSYNSYAFKKLDAVMKAADRHDLAVEFRVGYTWDYYAEEGSVYRFQDLLRDPSVRTAWLAFAEKLYQVGKDHPNFHGGFMTWEDFWNYVEDAGTFGTGSYSRQQAESVGFQDYLCQNYTLTQLNDLFQPAVPFESYSDIYIPGRRDYAYKLFYEFYDDFLYGLLEDTQKVFPGLSMEVRLDVDPVNGQDGTGSVGVPHDSTYPCGDSPYTSVMYSVSMGHGFGQQLSAAEAVKTMNEQLAAVRAKNGNKPVFIDQLLYMDATEGFESNARLLESHRGLFLMSIPDTLRTYTNGYAVWSYRNYTNNPVYNCQFALGSRGWEVQGGVTQERDGSMVMKLQAGGRLSQKIGHRISGRRTHDNHVRFTAESEGEGPVTVEVALGSNVQTVEVDGSGTFDLDFGGIEYYEVSFQTDGDVYLDNIQVYNFVQDGQLRDIDGNELSCMGAIRALNAALN